MLAYWLLFGIPAFGCTLERASDSEVRRGSFALALTMLLVCLTIGLRYHVGGDWNRYLSYLVRTDSLDLEELLNFGDPGYALLNWTAARIGADIWFVNFVCAIFFSLGLYVFAKDQPRPWLAVLIAVPYLVIVVAMGYTRQAVAIAFAMLGLASYTRDQSNLKFVLWTLLAATFHKTAVLLIPLTALATRRGRVWTLMWVGAASVVAYFTLLESSVGHLVHGYVEEEYDSAGATIRVGMNAVSGALFLIFRNRFDLAPAPRRLWTIMATLAIASIPALVYSPSSAPVDRLGLYLIPLQLVTLSRLPGALGATPGLAQFVTLGIVAYSGAVLFAWLNFASHASAWIPYQLYPI